MLERSGVRKRSFSGWKESKCQGTRANKFWRNLWQSVLDEERYIAAFASDKLRFSEQGPMRIKRELLVKDLPENLVESIVDRVMEENNYREVLASLLQKKLALLDSPDADAIQTKVLQWAYGKGFEWEDVLEAARQFLRL